MTRELFGTDGVRGLAGEYPLDSAGAQRVGRAVGVHFAQPGQSIVIGYDPRESSLQIVEDVTAGLTAVGVNVVSVEVIATPGLAYLTREHEEFVAGVMVTASHNPYQYNGIKVFAADGGKLSDEVEAELNQQIQSEIADRSAGSSSVNTDLCSQYTDFLHASVADPTLFTGIKVAVDAANGAASVYAAAVLEQLGAEVTPLFNTPDGRNINAGCGATDTRALQNAVKDGAFDLGIALDGDADRLILVDEQAREVKGDHLMYILAVATDCEGVVATVMSNLGFEQALQAKGIQLDRTAVGDRYVLEGLERSGFGLGGEQSGHIILPQILKTGDGLLAALQVMQAVQQSGKSLAAWRDEVIMFPQALVNLQLGDKTLLDQPDVQAYIKTQVNQLGERGRVLIRPSGTEPLVRVMVEADDAQVLAEKIAQELRAILGHQAIDEAA